MIAAAVTPAIDPFVVQQAEIRASRMVGNYGFTTDDWEDLRQDIMLDYLERLPRFDVSRGDLRGFGYGVVRNRAAKLAARQRRVAARLDLEWDEHRTEPALLSRPDADLDIRIDVQKVVARLPHHLRLLAQQLSEMSLGEVCRHTGKSRSRIYQWIRQIRAAFVEAGLTPEILAARGGAR